MVVDDKEEERGRRRNGYSGNIDRIIPVDFVSIANQSINMSESDVSGAGDVPGLLT